MKQRITSLDNFVNESNKSLDELKQTLDNMENNQIVKEIWSWVNQKRLSYEQFNELIGYCVNRFK